MAKVGNIFNRKIKNLLKAKNIQKLSKFKNLKKVKANKTFETNLLIFKVKKMFMGLKKVFTNALILCYLNLKFHI